MGAIQITAILLTMAALISYFNQRFMNMPGKTGHFALGLFFAALVVICEMIQPLNIHQAFRHFIGSAPFSDVLINGMLGILLFAGGLHVPLHLLEEQKRTIFGLAVITTFLNTFLIGGALYGFSLLLPYNISFLQALTFGALISPTDPVTALAVLTRIGLPKRLESMLVGESLFNDGLALVLFTVFAGLAFGENEVSWTYGLQFFATEVGGGFIMGLLVAGITHYLVRTVDDFNTHTLITVAAVIGGYVACLAIHVSGPIAMAVFGLIAGNFTFKSSINREERHDTSVFWAVFDNILTAVLFFLIGLQLIRVNFAPEAFIVVLVSVPIVLMSRFISIFAALNALCIERTCSRPQIKIVSLLTWAGLRGGLSIAMAFSITDEAAVKPMILDVTFAVVTFSILCQGLTINRFFSKEQLQALSQEQARASK